MGKREDSGFQKKWTQERCVAGKRYDDGHKHCEEGDGIELGTGTFCVSGGRFSSFGYSETPLPVVREEQENPACFRTTENEKSVNDDSRLEEKVRNVR